MTKVVFYGDPKLTGFCIKGHSTNNVDDEIGRLVCAFISSAAYMTANTVTDIIKANAFVFFFYRKLTDLVIFLP